MLTIPIYLFDLFFLTKPLRRFLGIFSVCRVFSTRSASDRLFDGSVLHTLDRLRVQRRLPITDLSTAQPPVILLLYIDSSTDPTTSRWLHLFVTIIQPSACIDFHSLVKLPSTQSPTHRTRFGTLLLYIDSYPFFL
jgi:hypothetical protein